MKPSEIRLIKDRLLIKPDPKESKIGSIIIPDKYHEDQETGVVVSTGQGRFDNKTGRKVPMQTKMGDRILFNKRQFETVKLESTEYYMLNDSEVLAVLT
jgi:chaperonin GroES